jgi:hypothetical protein
MAQGLPLSLSQIENQPHNEITLHQFDFPYEDRDTELLHGYGQHLPHPSLRQEVEEKGMNH